MPKRVSGESSIRKRADGRWIAQLTIKLADGRKKRISITNRDRDIVKAKLAEIHEQQRKLIPFSAKDWLVGDYMQYWLKEVTPLKIRKTTQIQYETVARLYINPTIGKKKLNELGVRDVQAAMDKLAGIGATARTRQKYRQILSSCLSHAMRE